MAGKTLRAELEELRAELARMKQARGAAEEAQAGPGPAHGAAGLLADAEAAIRKHPVMAAAGALVLGLLLGRIVAR